MEIFKLIPILCTHVYSYMFSTLHPPSIVHDNYCGPHYIQGNKH